MISEEDLTKYNSSAKICGIVFREIVLKISNNEMLETNLLNEYGDRRILEECSKIYKREDKNIAFPTSISLNDCVGNYIYGEGRDDYNIIKNGDVVKIENEEQALEIRKDISEVIFLGDILFNYGERE